MSRFLPKAKVVANRQVMIIDGTWKIADRNHFSFDIWHQEMLVCLENTTSGGALTQRSLASTQIYVDAINDVRTSHIPSKPSKRSDGSAGYPTRKYKTRAEVSLLQTSDSTVRAKLNCTEFGGFIPRRHSLTWGDGPRCFCHCLPCMAQEEGGGSQAIYSSTDREEGMQSVACITSTRLIFVY